MAQRQYNFSNRGYSDNFFTYLCGKTNNKEYF